MYSNANGKRITSFTFASDSARDSLSSSKVDALTTLCRKSISWRRMKLENTTTNSCTYMMLISWLEMRGCQVPLRDGRQVANKLKTGATLSSSLASRVTVQNAARQTVEVGTSLRLGNTQICYLTEQMDGKAGE